MATPIYPPHVGLMGWAGTGKDTAGRFLVEAYGYASLAFADPLRDLALFLDPIVDGTHVTERGHVLKDFRYSEALEAYGYRDAKDLVPGVRRLLDYLGRGVRDVLGPDTWVSAAVGRIEAIAPRPVVVTDVRFQNEAEAIRALGGVLVRLERPDVPPIDAPSDHVLDGYPADFTYTRTAEAPLEALYAFMAGVALSTPRRAA